MTSIPEDYLVRLYAGILGKLIGVYLGRPFENWTYQEIQDKLGDIHDYVHHRLGLPLVVVDDDVSGTFKFVHALEEHGISPDLSSEAIGKTWLNNVIEQRSIFWWGGNGISTEHTTFLNLKKGIPAPRSGSMATNGQTLSEQIGSQIFIDAWAMVAPGNPALAVKLAEAAARVSHDGEAVYAAKLWAAMEAEAFRSADVNHLLDTGLRFIPNHSMIARLISDIRTWFQTEKDWRVTRQKIEHEYGYDKYLGICHVVPNHGIMIMALLYGGHDFHKAMHIINTCGWDTDCNSGNVGCLVAIMHGLAAFEHGPDWRGPLADRAIISSADNGYSINDAVRITYDLANIAHTLSGQPRIEPPKDGAQYHFSLPGSVQGFQLTGECDKTGIATLDHGQDGPVETLRVQFKRLSDKNGPIDAMTPTFSPLEVLRVKRDYELMASPLIYPGQKLRAQVRAGEENTGKVTISLRLQAYDADDSLKTVDGTAIELQAGEQAEIEWTIPATLQNCPIQQIGLSIGAKNAQLDGAVHLHSLRWDGTPQMVLQRPHGGSCDLWQRAWVSSVDKVHTGMGPSFFIAQDEGEGILTQGTRDWLDYRISVSQFIVNLGTRMGVAARVRGLNRYYAIMFLEGDRVALIKAADEKRIELSSEPFKWQHDKKYDVILTVEGNRIKGQVGDLELMAFDEDYRGGAAGLVVNQGSLSAGAIEISPALH